MPYEFSPYLIDNKDFLQKLSKTRSERIRKNHLDKATSEQLFAIVEIIKNILRGNFPLPKRRRQKLAPFANYYRSVARSRSERAARERLQTGGAVPLAAILAPVLGAIAQHILDRTLLKKEGDEIR